MKQNYYTRKNAAYICPYLHVSLINVALLHCCSDIISF
jgi:hypothetical protein